MTSAFESQDEPACHIHPCRPITMPRV